MILDSLELHNIRSHKDTTVKFPKGGITLFSGDIGSGKSTILMGIELALFGLSSLKADGLLAKNADSGEAVLIFHIGNTKYEIGRTLRRNRNKISQDNKGTYLMINDVKEPLSATQLKTRILDILGLNEPSSANAKSRIYRYAIFTPQDEMKSILWDSAKRLESIRKIFRMEDYQTAKQNTDVIKSNIKHLLSRFEAKFEDMEDIKSNLAQSKQKIQELQDVIKTKSQTKEDHIKNEQEIKSDAKKYETRLNEKHILNMRHTEIKSKLEGEKHMRAQHEQTSIENKNRIKQLEIKLNQINLESEPPTSQSIEMINTEIKKFTDLNENIITTRSEITSTDRQINSLKSKISNYDDNAVTALEEQLNDNISKLNLSKKELDELNLEHENTKTAKITTTSKVDNIEQSVSELQKLGAKCTLCGHILTKEHMSQQESERRSSLDALQSKLDDLSNVFKIQSEQITNLETQCDDFKSTIDSLKLAIPDVKEHTRLLSIVMNLREKTKKLDAQNVIPATDFAKNQTHKSPVEYFSALKDALSKYESAQKNLSDIKDEMTHLDDKNKEIDRDISSSIERASAFESELVTISTSLKEYAKDDDAISEINSKLDLVQKSLRQTSDELSASRANLENEKNRIIQFESDIKDAEHWQKKHKKYDAYMNWLGDFFIPNISSIEKNVLLSIQNEFNESYRTWYGQLVNDATKDSRIDENFAPIIEQDGFTQPVDYLSGGEKTSVALAYRLALNFAMRSKTPSLESNLLILDEPTDGMSRTQLDNLKPLLEGLNSKQIILVSHDQNLYTAMDNVFSVVKQSGGATTVSLEKSS